LRGARADALNVRRLVLILAAFLAAQARAEPGNELLLEKRAWRGFVEVTSSSWPPPGGKGGETQTERAEFVVITEPPRRTIGWAKLIFALKESKGRYTLALDTREGEGKKLRTAQGSGSGRLHVTVLGFLEPKTRKYRLALQVTPRDLIARHTIAGFADGRFTTWRCILSRRPFLAAFDHTGVADKDLRVMEGAKTFTDRRVRLARKVTVKWRVERVDPVLKGRVVDHHGRPLAGIKVVASTTNAGRRTNGLPPIFKEGVTDEAGRFSIDAWWSHWQVRVKAERRKGLVLAGGRVENGVQLRFDDVPGVTMTVPVYRLEVLPRFRKLPGHFQDDVERYLEWIRPRVPSRRLEVALTPPAER